ncbi:MAG: Hsp70 family protein [Nitrospira sp.]
MQTTVTSTYPTVRTVFGRELTRDQLNQLCTALARTNSPSLPALKDAGLSPTDIDEVVLVGGSTHAARANGPRRSSANSRTVT